MGKQRRSELPLHAIHQQHESPTSSTSRSSEDANPLHEHGVTSHHRIRSLGQMNKKALQGENEVTNALAARACHLPGYNYWQDLAQYLVNNHLVFGMCCKHKKHPLGTRIRALNLLGSALCGLAVTNVIWLSYIYYDEDPNSVLFKVNFGGSTYLSGGNATHANVELNLPGPKNQEAAQQLAKTLQITKGMILLWTVGGSLHAMYDCTIWRASACACCLPGNRCERLSHLKSLGGYFTFFIVILVTALASFVVVLRATLMSRNDMSINSAQSVGFVDDAIRVGESVKDLGVFEFVVGYFVEFILALFLYYPFFGALLFSGVLGCGRIPILGGRPYEMRQLEKQASRSIRSTG